MKRVTMELGGHAPAIVFKDADIGKTVKLLGGAKFRNAGQVCISPTRFLVQEDVYEEFVDGFIKLTKEVKVGDGMDPQTKMGPLMHARRVEAMEGFVADAQKAGANLRTGGKRIGNQGYFFEPTVFTEVPLDARVMNEEPFGPIASIVSFKEDEEAFEEANRLPYGLAAYAYTRSATTATKVASVVETGMMSVNHQGLGIPELPLRRRQGFRFRERGRLGGDRGLPQHQARLAGGDVGPSGGRCKTPGPRLMRG
jgi:succinate-semialdehyde dehydrogenase/glutarate-semialdehyde dehydrogenase